MPASRSSSYVKLLGGNINPLSFANEDTQRLKQKCRYILTQLRRHPPCVLSGWVYAKLVDWPLDILTNLNGNKDMGQSCSSCANVARRCLNLPLKTPWMFLYGKPEKGV